MNSGGSLTVVVREGVELLPMFISRQELETREADHLTTLRRSGLHLDPDCRAAPQVLLPADHIYRT
jgi:hypothetical protein